MILRQAAQVRQKTLADFILESACQAAQNTLLDQRLEPFDCGEPMLNSWLVSAAGGRKKTAYVTV